MTGVNHFPTFRREVSRPRMDLPAGSWDTAAHVYGDPDRFPLSSKKKWFLPDTAATVEELVKVHDQIGIERGVLVQATSYGPDHSVLLEALHEHPDRFVGIGVISDEVDDAQLHRLDEAGVRGARFNLCSWIVANPPAPDDVLRQIARIRPLGWHAVLHLDANFILENRDLLEQITDIPVCVDHLAHFNWEIGPGHKAFEALADQMRRKGWWIRLSNADRGSALASGYDDMVNLIRAFVDVAPEQVVWGTDWPHVYYKKSEMVDDGAMLELLERAIPDESTRTRILVDNPRRFYARST